jgi:hypothetical protein
MDSPDMAGDSWIRTPAKAVDTNALTAALRRYHLRPDGDVWSWITGFERLITRDEQQWFLSHRDFTNQSEEDAFRWDEFEQMSLDAAGDDSAWKKSITGFWERHLPLYLDVRSGYRALVVRVSNGVGVGIFESVEPEFEEVTPFATSLVEMQRLVFGQ